MTCFRSFLYVCLLISHSLLAYYPLGLKNWPAGSVICSRWTWLRLDRMDEKLNNAYWISPCFAINFLTNKAQNELTDKRNKNNFENFSKDITINPIYTMLWSIVDYPLDLIHIHCVYYSCQHHLWFISRSTLFYLYPRTWLSIN